MQPVVKLHPRGPTRVEQVALVTVASLICTTKITLAVVALVRVVMAVLPRQSQRTMVGGVATAESANCPISQEMTHITEVAGAVQVTGFRVVPEDRAEVVAEQQVVPEVERKMAHHTLVAAEVGRTTKTINLERVAPAS